jgi:hypothetical protein
MVADKKRMRHEDVAPNGKAIVHTSVKKRRRNASADLPTNRHENDESERKEEERVARGEEASADYNHNTDCFFCFKRHGNTSIGAFIQACKKCILDNGLKCRRDECFNSIRYGPYYCTLYKPNNTCQFGNAYGNYADAKAQQISPHTKQCEDCANTYGADIQNDSELIDTSSFTPSSPSYMPPPLAYRSFSCP